MPRTHGVLPRVGVVDSRDRPRYCASRSWYPGRAVLVLHLWAMVGGLMRWTLHHGRNGVLMSKRLTSHHVQNGVLKRWKLTWTCWMEEDAWAGR
ncbi:hypothetical protein L873DRAFT_981389 [Choiromyces venosus 120613-1]|uniref:Uncharacterized protein n=1 Tax=Choiromyces venosus 120613-1 TaxID=1336337 RepID=A0A3N4JL82_9PEZI|nr:hypothetical protein L873DRAFT_981389 [Choiromyces venosus 120613-1]